LITSEERGTNVRKILIANRGEIASRIIRTCQQLGIETVAVYSDADAHMPFVKEADIAYRIGESPVNKSYLNMETIIQIAKDEKVDGIHPGYGLLSENAQFAKKVEEAGISFIGPKAETIEKMGDKIAARKTMQQAGVPVVPGSDESCQTIEEARQLAQQIGYPVMLKASGGGGGIGMIRCDHEQALVQNFASTKNRAKAYFGSDEVFIEKCINNGRHIEVQIFGDTFGNYVHLFERNCSVQRRNQKVIEEALSPALSEETREKMYTAAIQAAKAVKYVNAGTVEFIVDEHENFYFLEMNTRLQVEHPVTEKVTGFDLVKWQIQVAAGEPLPIKQQDIVSQGHSIEFRVYAEDPVTFYPSPGKITKLYWPDVSSVRVDSGYEEGGTVTPFYDPMIAKVIVSGRDRNDCLLRAKEYIELVEIEGIKTNIPLLKEMLNYSAFVQGTYTTQVVQQLYSTKK
jgi:acetyl-CoA carboxylase, biotin carboxylase subunit